MNHSWKRKFLTITAGQTVSLIGSSAVQFALIWWLSETTASPMLLSLAGLAAFLPQLVLGPFVGVWLDRWKRKRVVMGADLAMGVLAALFALYFALSGNPPVWSVFLVLFLRGVGGVFHTPAIQALIPMLVPQEALLKANGWSQFLQSGAFMLGPALGAVLYTVCPMPLVLLTDLLGALVAVGALACIPVPEPGVTGAAAPDFKAEFREGIAVFRARPALLHLLLAAGLCMVFFMPLSSLYPLMTSSYFNLNSAHGSLVEIVYAAGMMLSALILGRMKPGHALRRAWVGLVGLAVVTLACGLVPNSYGWFWGFALGCLGMGAFGNVYGLPIMAHMQADIPPEKLGRAFSLMGSVMSLSMPVGLVLAGPCAERWGVARWFLISGVAMLVITGGMLLLRPRGGADVKIS